MSDEVDEREFKISQLEEELEDLKTQLEYGNEIGPLLWSMARWMQESERVLGLFILPDTQIPEHKLRLAEGRFLREQAERWAKLRANYQFSMGVR